MYSKTRVAEKGAVNRSLQDDQASSKNGKSLPAIHPVQKVEEEEPLQGKFEPVQKVEEEEALQGKFETVQKVEEEEPLQGKFEPVQKVEEEEALQGKFEPVQKVEEEEALQGKFEPVQKVEEEEPLQGKFETVQKVEEEEPLQGKFETVQKAEEEEPLQGKFEPVQKAEEEEALQGKFEPVQKKKSNPSLISHSSQVVQKNEDATAPNKTGMPNSLKNGIESLSGFSMDDVKVHYNSDKPKQLQAHAYAQGTDIHIGPGQEKHLPHEAWHAAQQKQGRVQPTVQMKQGVPVNDDAGLETEADVMGAKAASLGNEQAGTAQLRFNTGLLSSRRVAQRKTIQRNPEETPTLTRGRASRNIETEEAKFQRENLNMINLVTNAGGILSEINWGDLAKGADSDTAATVGTVATGAGVVGSLTGLSGTATNKIQKTDVPDVQGAAGDITLGVGSSIGALVKSVIAIKNAYTLAKGKEDKIVGTGQIAIAIMSALKSGCEAAASIQKFINGSVPPVMKSLIPGLGIAIAACEIIVNAYSLYNSYSAESEMSGVTGEFKAGLVTVLGGEPETVTPKLFANEKRGKFGNRITYLRLKPGLYEELDKVMERGITSEEKQTRATAFKTKYEIGSSVNIDVLYSSIKNYELGSKMQEINQKRKVQGARNIFTNLIAMAGEIAKFFPADGGITAGVLLGASAAIGAAQSAGKFIQGLARNGTLPGGDSNRSSSSKHKEYVNHTRSIYEYLNSIPQPVTEESKSKMTKGEQLVKATGVNMAIVYATDYSNSGSKTNQVKAIVEAMKAGR